jgi:hypothetical protein
MQQVTQLLYTSIQLEKPQDNPELDFRIRRNTTELDARMHGALPCFKALWALPSAQSISASTVADMMQLAAQQQRFWLGKQLCELPAAQQVSAQELCEVVVHALEHEDAPAKATDRLVRQVLHLPAAQQLP